MNMTTPARKITAQVALEAIINSFNDYDESTINAVRSEAIAADVSEFYVDMLDELIVG